MKRLIFIVLLMTTSVFAGLDAKSGKVVNVATPTDPCDAANKQYVDDTSAAEGHNILSTAHGDTITDAVTRGSLIYGNSTPAWDELVLGASGYILRSDGTDITWSPTTNITALGTINTGVWSATALVANKVPNHDNLNNVDVNSHLDWTAATDALYTTGSGRFDGGIGIGTAPVTRLLRIYGSTATLGVGLEIDNLGAADAFLRFALCGVAKFVLGVDNSIAGDPFKIAVGTALGTNDALAIDSSGNFDFYSGNFANVGTIGCGAITGGAYNDLTFLTNDLRIDDVANNNSLLVSGDWYIDQDIGSGAAPTFTADNFSDGGSNIIPTSTQETNWDNHIADNTQAHTDYLLNNEDDSTSGSLVVSSSVPSTDDYISMSVLDSTYGNSIKMGIIGRSSWALSGIWLNQATPSPTNFAFLGVGTETIFNAPTNGKMYFRVGNSNKWAVSNTGELLSGADGTAAHAITTTGLISTGTLSVTGESLFSDKVKFTQVDGNEYIDSLADGYMDYGATTTHRFNANVDVTGGIKSSGGRIFNETRYTTTQTLDNTDHIVSANTDGGAWTLSLPAGVVGTEYEITNTGSSGNNLTIAPNGAEDLIGTNANWTLFDAETLKIIYRTTDGWY